MTTTRKEYLRRPLIKGVIYQIGDNLIRVSSPNTIFINMEKSPPILLSDVENLFRELRKIAKHTPKLKLKGVTRFISTIRELHPAYAQGVELKEKNFSEIIELFRQIQIDGLHVGYVNDELLNLANTKRFEIERLHYFSNPYSRFVRCFTNLRTILAERNWENEEIEHCVVSLLSF